MLLANSLDLVLNTLSDIKSSKYFKFRVMNFALQNVMRVLCTRYDMIA